MKKIIFLAGFFLSLNSWSLSSYQKDLQKIIQSSEKDSVRLEKLFKTNWHYQMVSSPETATYLGYPGQNDRWSDNSKAAIELRNEEKKFTLKAIKSIARKNLKSEVLLSYDLFLKNAQEQVDALAFPEELLPLNQMWGIQVDMADLLSMAPKNKISDYYDMISRLKAAPQALDQIRDLLSEGARRGITHPQIVLREVPQQVSDLITGKVTDSPLYLAFAEIKINISEKERSALQNEAQLVIEKVLYPALKDFRKFLTEKYLPQCRQTVGFSSIPQGAAWYTFKIKRHTTVDMSASEIHELGLKEVARIQAEMEKVKEQVKFKGDLAAFNKFIRTDSQFIYSNSNDLMIGYRDIAKRIDAELPRLFGRLPKLPYGVREMPAFKAPSAPTAYYMGGSLESGRAGYFEANTYDLKARPKWQMEALTLHEAVPGHHLQIALAQELTGLPEFRKNMGPTSYIEGWGLYAESLGAELGLYQDPYAKYGQLTYEIWRAIRLVVDTGLHAKGWSRDQVLKYMKDNSPISEQQIINETDRYIADPGQALAYKIGELKIKELRKKAEQKLGESFSIREFHDQVLSSGAIPMDVLEKKITTWIDSKNKKIH